MMLADCFAAQFEARDWSAEPGTASAPNEDATNFIRFRQKQTQTIR